MAMGKRRRDAKQASMWVALCHRFYADEVGRPGLAPGRYFRLLLIGYFEGLDAKRAIAWRTADSFAVCEFLGLVFPEAPPDHSTISRTRHLIDLETHQAVFTWILQRVADRVGQREDHGH